MSDNNIVVIPSAGKPKSSLFPNTYDPMIPINGIPTIKHIINELGSRNFNEFIVIINKKDKQSKHFLDFLRKKERKKIKIIQSKGVGGPGNSIIEGIKEIKGCSLLSVNLGDTLYYNKKIKKTDLILVSDRKHFDSKEWAFVKNKIDKQEFIDKPEAYEGGYILCGYYQFKNFERLKEICHNLNSNKKIEISEILKEYSNKVNRFDLEIENGDWFDLGHLNGYINAKVSLLRTRSFNSLSYDDFRGIITKKSKKVEKIKSEINWYLNIPNELKIFSPRITDFFIGENYAEYSLEFYGYPSLADLFLFGNLSDDQWKFILNKLIMFYGRVEEDFKIKLPNSIYHSIYKLKTEKRIKDFLRNKELKKIWNYDKIILNNKEYKNVKEILTETNINKILKIILKNKKDSIIHGDFCFSNILFDLHSGVFKIIDPRGSFGDMGIYGDINYDIAKLRHSVSGKYEFIISDLFLLKQQDNKFEINFYRESPKIEKYFDNLIGKKYNLDLIKIIEGLLFISMIPLHSDSKDRQIMMYLRAVKLFNETLKRSYF